MLVFFASKLTLSKKKPQKLFYIIWGNKHKSKDIKSGKQRVLKSQELKQIID